MDPSALTLEITETMVMDDLSSAREIMKRLNRLGVRLAIDDFGTGHSSLSYLKQFPVHEVKVDRVFVQGLSDHPVDSAIVRAVVELASAMGMLAVAEGVETADQLSRLRISAAPSPRATSSPGRSRSPSTTGCWSASSAPARVRPDHPAAPPAGGRASPLHG